MPESQDSDEEVSYGPSRRYHPEGVLEVIQELTGPDRPVVSAGEVVEGHEASRPTVLDLLAELREEDGVGWIQVGNAKLYYLPDELPEQIQEAGGDERDTGAETVGVDRGDGVGTSGGTEPQALETRFAGVERGLSELESELSEVRKSLDAMNIPTAEEDDTPESWGERAEGVQAFAKQSIREMLMALGAGVMLFALVRIFPSIGDATVPFASFTVSEAILFGMAISMLGALVMAVIGVSVFVLRLFNLPDRAEEKYHALRTS